MSDAITIDTMSLADLQTALKWAANEHWNPGVSDVAAFHAADPQGFFMARVDGVPVAAISVVNHDAENAFLGLYICLPDWRGKGIGFRTWTHAMAHAGTRSIGLDGVPDQEDNYSRSGFVRTGQSLRYVGRWPSRSSSFVCAVQSDDLASLIQMDAKANGFSRPAFLQAWMAPDLADRGTRVLVEDGEITGCATWRVCQDGTKIGPVLAGSTDSALTLIADVAALRPDGPLVIDLPEANITLRNALEQAGFDVPFTTARMYRGMAPKTGPMLQAIASMELG